MYVGTGALWKISVPSSQFCHEPKTSLKYIVYIFLKVQLGIDKLNQNYNENIGMINSIRINKI